MAKVYAFVSDGMEEVECLATCDVLVRAGIEVKLVSVTGKREVTGSHGFTITADLVFEELAGDDADVLFLPGGMPGTANLTEHEGLAALLKKHAATGKRLAAICAAPSVLGGLGLLEGRRATCFPGWEEKLLGAEVLKEGVVTDGTVTTGRGMGWSLDLGLELVRLLIDEETAKSLKTKIQYDR
ncbi:MAG: DJ-1/PfpI family protein [Lachnospiraceae bacterium]|nr:DJ-1/PfpI family protein [Lachnospiraceae bacterium]